MKDFVIAGDTVDGIGDHDLGLLLDITIASRNVVKGVGVCKGIGVARGHSGEGWLLS